MIPFTAPYHPLMLIERIVTAGIGKQKEFADSLTAHIFGRLLKQLPADAFASVFFIDCEKSQFALIIPAALL